MEHVSLFFTIEGWYQESIIERKGVDSRRISILLRFPCLLDL